MSHSCSFKSDLKRAELKSFYDLASEVFKGLGKEVKINWIPMPEHIREQYQYFTEAPMGKLRSLDFLDTSFHNLEDGVQDFIRERIECIGLLGLKKMLGLCSLANIGR